MSEYTPGPWLADDLAIFADREGHDVIRVADVSPEDGSKQTDRELVANAHLIAAAPELLEALLTALPFVEDAQEAEYKPGHLSKAQRLIRAVITKASGSI